MSAKWWAKCWKSLILALATALVVTLGPMSPVEAKPQPTSPTATQPAPSMQAQRRKPAYARLLRPYVHRYGVSWHFKKKVPAKIVKKVGKARIKKLKRYWANVKRHRYPTVAALKTQADPSMRWVGKHGTIQLKWFGLRIWMDAYMTRHVLNGLLAAATILAMLKGPYSRVIALALYVYYGGLWACRNSRTKTTTVYVLAVPPYPGVPGLLFCNPFN